MAIRSKILFCANANCCYSESLSYKLRFALYTGTGADAGAVDSLAAVSEDSVGWDRGKEEGAAWLCVFCEGTGCVCVPFSEIEV